MIFDIYEQSDLFRIANCGRRSTLERWLSENRIPYNYDAHGKVMAHKKAVDAGLGVEADAQQGDTEPKLWLGDNENAA